MKRKHKTNNELNNLSFGTIIGTVIFSVIISLFAIIMTKKDLPERYLIFFIIFSLIISAFAAGFLSKRKSVLKGYAAGAIPSAILTIFVFAATVIVNRFMIDKSILLLIPTGILSGISGGIISANMR